MTAGISEHGGRRGHHSSTHSGRFLLQDDALASSSWEHDGRRGRPLSAGRFLLQAAEDDCTALESAVDKRTELRNKRAQERGETTAGDGGGEAALDDAEREAREQRRQRCEEDLQKRVEAVAETVRVVEAKAAAERAAEAEVKLAAQRRLEENKATALAALRRAANRTLPQKEARSPVGLDASPLQGTYEYLPWSEAYGELENTAEAYYEERALHPLGRGGGGAKGGGAGGGQAASGGAAGAGGVYVRVAAMPWSMKASVIG